MFTNYRHDSDTSKSLKGHLPRQGCHTGRSSRVVQALTIGASLLPLLLAYACGRGPDKENHRTKVAPESSRESANSIAGFANAGHFTLVFDQLTPTVEVDDVLRIRVFALTADGERVPLQNEKVKWSVEDRSVLRIRRAGDTVDVTGKKVGMTTLTARVEGVEGVVTVAVIPSTLMRIELSPVEGEVAIGLRLNYRCTGFSTNGTKRDVTDLVAWSTEVPKVARIDGQGRAEGKAVGSTSVVASVGSFTTKGTLRVTSAMVNAIEISPSELTLPVGDSRQLLATALLSDGTTTDVTRQVQWTRNGDAGALSDTGLLLGLREGTVDITARFTNFKGLRLKASARAAVEAAQLRSIAVDPPKVSLPLGWSTPLRATGLYSDRSSRDITNEVLWSSTDGAIATVQSDANGVTLVARGLGKAMARATSGNVGASIAVEVTDAVLTSLVVGPRSTLIPVGFSQTFHATGVFSDGSSRDVSDLVTWTSSNSRVLTISNAFGEQGLARGIMRGDSAVVASYAGIVARSKAVVSPLVLQSIAISPPAASVAKGKTLQYTATGTFGKDAIGPLNLTHDITNDVVWSSNNTSIATVGNAASDRGLVSALGVGAATIGATAKDRAAAAPLVVSAAEIVDIEVAPSVLRLQLGTSGILAVTALYTDGSKADVTADAFFATSDREVATVGNFGEDKGRVSGVGSGKTTVTTRLGPIHRDTVVEVVEPILLSLEISPPMPSIPRGTEVGFTATGHYENGQSADLTAIVTWYSSVPEVAVFGPLAGTSAPLTALDIGQTRIIAQLGSINGETTVTVTAPAVVGLEVMPDMITLSAGQTRQLAAFALYGDGSRSDVTQSAIWTTDDSATAAIVNTEDAWGLLTGIAPGSAVISAIWNGFSATSRVTVSPALLLGIDVSPGTTTLHVGGSLAMRAFGRYEDQTTREITTEVVWASRAPAVVTVRNDAIGSGQISAVGVGRAVIAASVGTVEGTAIVAVNAAKLLAIEIAPMMAAVPAGLSLPLTAIGRYEDQSARVVTNEVTWSSSNRDIATVTSALPTPGVVSGVAVGEATIGAALDGVTSETRVRVVDAVVVSLSLTLPRRSIPLGTVVSAEVTAHYSDGRSQLVTNFATFTSSDAEVASVSHVPDTIGRIVTKAVGTTLIAARYEDFGAETELAVTAAELASISVLAPSRSLPLGLPRYFAARGIFTDQSVVDLTQTVAWSTDHVDVAVGSNDLTTKGLITPIGIGATEVRATQGGFSGAVTLIVNDATLSSIAVTPEAPRIHFGDTVAMHANGAYSDGSTFDLTEVATWVSEDGAVARITNLAGERGIATALQHGTTVLRAYYGGSSGNTTLAVDANLSAVQITPIDTTVSTGDFVQLSCQGTYEDGLIEDVTEAAQWTTSEQEVATISAGKVTGRRQGSTTVTATLNGLSTSSTVRVGPPRLVALEATPDNVSLPKGTELTLAVVAIYSDGSRQNPIQGITYESANPGVATVDGALTVHGLAVGSTTVLLRFEGAVTRVPVTVAPAIVRALAIDPPLASIVSGRTATFTAVATYSDGSTGVVADATFVVENDAVATIAEAQGPGVIIGRTPGESVITATAAGFSASSRLTVTPPELTAVVVRPSYVQLPAGTSVTMVAEGVYSDGRIGPLLSPVVWTSTRQRVATVDASGILVAFESGETEVRAAAGGFFSPPVPVEVIAARLVQLTLSPDQLSLALGRSASFQAIAWYSDQTFGDVSGLAVWDTSAPEIATISTSGTVTSQRVGVATVTASFLGATGTAEVVVLPAEIIDVSITPPPTLAVGRSTTLTATAHYSDGSSQPLFSGVTWRASSLSSVVEISGTGTVTALAVGTANVTAQFGEFATIGTITTIAAVVDTVVVTSSSGALARGETSQLGATAIYSDRSTVDVTREGTWAVADSSVVTVDSRGLVFALDLGTTTVSCSFGGVTGATTVSVGTGATFATLCSDPLLPEGARATINEVLALFGTSDCQNAAGRLAAATSLDLSGRSLTDLSPLSTALALRWLYLDRNNVVDLAPLSGLTDLRGLYLNDNLVSDIAPLASLTQLAHLSLDRNPLTTLAALAANRNLQNLSINGVAATDFSVLTELVALKGLFADGTAANGALANAEIGTLAALSARHGNIDDATPLSEAAQMRWLSLDGNNLRNISPLAALDALEVLLVSANPIVREEAACPTSAANRPLMNFCVGYLYQ